MGRKKQIETEEKELEAVISEEETEVITATEEPVLDESLPFVTKVKVPKLNLRERPDTASKVIKILDEGTALECTDENEKFYKVHTKGLEGYVMKEFVEV
jgi:uncharacterized protein YgiM (DUF1202 family)